jgi:hypothetical protein
LVLMIIGIKQQYIYFTSYPSLGRGANLWHGLPTMSCYQ